MLTVTFVRHGQSTDNTIPIWAGWKDAPLSNDGMIQAKALAAHWAEVKTPVHFIYASDLKRAHSTGLQVYNVLPDPKPPMKVTELIREQHFGVAEGNTWVDPGNKNKVTGGPVYEVPKTRDARFEGGESTDDVFLRANKAVDEFIVPHVEGARGKKEGEVHVVLFSHGLFISEAISALVKKSGVEQSRDYRGLVNTGWTRLTIESKPDSNDTQATNWEVKVIAINRAPHLSTAKKQGGSIGRAVHDEKQTTITSFFGGGGAASTDDKQ